MKVMAGVVLTLLLGGCALVPEKPMLTEKDAEPRQLTTQQMKALAPKDVDRIVRDDLLSLLQPADPIQQGVGLWLRDARLATRPFNTAYEGLCRRDVLRVRYAPVDSAGPYVDRPLRPYSVETIAQFALRRAPPLAWLRPEPHRVLGKDCERMVGDATVRWFDAPDDLNAALAINVLDAAVTGARAGKLTTCPPSNVNCGALSMKDVKLQNLYRILSCNAERAGTVCYQYHFDPATAVTVVAWGNGGGPNVSDISPDEVVSVEVGVLIDDG